MIEDMVIEFPSSIVLLMRPYSKFSVISSIKIYKPFIVRTKNKRVISIIYFPISCLITLLFNCVNPRKEIILLYRNGIFMEF